MASQSGAGAGLDEVDAETLFVVRLGEILDQAATYASDLAVVTARLHAAMQQATADHRWHRAAGLRQTATLSARAYSAAAELNDLPYMRDGQLVNGRPGQPGAPPPDRSRPGGLGVGRVIGGND